MYKGCWIDLWLHKDGPYYQDGFIQIIDATKAFLRDRNIGAYGTFADDGDYPVNSVWMDDVVKDDLETAIFSIFPVKGDHVNYNVGNNTIRLCTILDIDEWWILNVLQAWFDVVAPYMDNAELKIYPGYPDTSYGTIGKLSKTSVIWKHVGEHPQDILQEAIDYINEFTEYEYGDIAITEGDNLSDVGIMFTYAGDDDEYVTEVSVNLIDYTISYFVNGEMVEQDKFSSLSEMNDTLSRLSFDWLYHTCCSHIDWDEE